MSDKPSIGDPYLQTLAEMRDSLRTIATMLSDMLDFLQESKIA